MNTLTFEQTGRQRRRPLIGAGIGLVLAASCAVLSAVTGVRAVVGAIGFGLTSLVFIGFFILSARDFTTCDDKGIKFRALGKSNAWSWSEIQEIEVKTYAVRGVSRSVIFVSPKNGKPVGLTVPIHGGATKDPAFGTKAKQIQECWRRNSGSVAA